MNKKECIIIGKRRFTALSDTLIRMEFSPDGQFEDRRSIVAYNQKEALPFLECNITADKLLLKTKKLEVHSCDNDKAMFPENIEIRWVQGDILQCWRPGDVDHQNIGGTIRSLDVFNHHAALNGVHPADSNPLDSKAMTWLSWEICEDAPDYYEKSGLKDYFKNNVRNDLHRSVKYSKDKIYHRLKNQSIDSYKYSPGILSKSGYTFLNDSTSAVLDNDDFPVERNRPGYQDWYFFAYGKDYRQALADFIILTGKAPIPDKKMLGLIFSRWPAFGEIEAKEIVGKFHTQKIPLTGLIVDMEWHKEGWSHWDWNEELFPDHKRFFNWCHKHDLLVSLNVHPMRIRDDDSHYEKFLRQINTKESADLYYNGKKLRKIDINNCDKNESKAFMDICHSEVIKEGLDYWWVDGTQGKMNGTTSQLVTNKTYFENASKLEKRGMLLSRYGGIGSHRYGTIFTGDTYSQWKVLKHECEFNIRAGHLGLAYISHDIGGFSTHASAPLIAPDLYMRWLQFGVWNPVLRLHSAPGCGSRMPWDYGENNLKIATKWLQIRHSLMPYIYSKAREHYETGIPIVRGLFLDDPDNENAYRFDEFFFGESILVAPVLSNNESRQVYLPNGEWYTFLKGEKIIGGSVFDVISEMDHIPVYIKEGSIITRQSLSEKPSASHIENLVLDVYPGNNSSTILYEDDGKTPDYKQKAYCKTQFKLYEDNRSIIISGKVIEGKTFNKNRDVCVDILLAEKPEKIEFNKKELPASACQTGDLPNKYRINLGTINSDDNFELCFYI